MDEAPELACQRCGHRCPPAPGALTADGGLRDPVDRCIACGSSRLFVQKDFNRRLGLAIVLVGAALSPWTYGGSLVVCLLIDYALYFVVPEVTVCYGCDAIHRGFQHNPAHRAHDPLLAERFGREARQEAAEMPPGGSAKAAGNGGPTGPGG